MDDRFSCGYSINAYIEKASDNRSENEGENREEPRKVFVEVL